MKLVKVKTKNFKSFINNEFEFSKKGNVQLIYGANGVGKTTLIETVNLLSDVLRRENNIRFVHGLPPAVRNTLPNNGGINLFPLFATEGSNEPIQMEYHFFDVDDNIERRYVYSFTMIEGDSIVKEKLSVFEANKKEKVLYSKEFMKEYIKPNLPAKIDIEEMNISKNTQTSVLSILFDIVSVNGGSVVKQEFNEDDNDWYYFRKFFSSVFLPYSEMTNEAMNLRSGFVTIAKNDVHIKQKEKELNSLVREFSSFVKDIDKYITDVKLKKYERMNGLIDYVLTYKKELSDGRFVELDHFKESTGTKTYFSIFLSIRQLISKKNEAIVIFDEYCANLHEELAIKITQHIKKVATKNNKQVIIATHSAILLDNKLTSTGTIFSLDNDEKLIMQKSRLDNSIILFDLKNVNKKENNHFKYLIGAYGGVPQIGEID